MTQVQKHIFTVGQLNRKAKQLLETHLPLVWVEGEISNLTRHSSGHWYFTLKDEKAQVSCAMFRTRNALVQFKPQHGQAVLLRARVSLYEPRGGYQLIAEHMEPAGFGALQRAFEELKSRLDNEGLFQADYKRPLPAMPRHIGVITSPTGAAVRDILTVLKRRFAGIPVSVFPVAVQGADASAQIVKAIQTANTLARDYAPTDYPRRALTKTPCDVLILGRGGGSLEDLWAFNEESVAREIFASQIPVISAVGHETDFTIADFVADVRAPTPSAAAELVSPDAGELLKTFSGYELLLTQAVFRLIAGRQQQVDNLHARIRHPGERLQAQAQHLDNLEMRLLHCMRAQLKKQQDQLEKLTIRQSQFHPEKTIKASREQLTQLYNRLCTQTRTHLHSQKQSLAALVQLLQSVSPLNVLSRGYAIVTDADQKVITDANNTAPGDQVFAQLAKGTLTCTVESSGPDTLIK